MATLLHLDASARVARSITRRLSALFVERWLARAPATRVIRRDLGLEPPPFISEAWIAACFTPEQERNAAMREVLAWSEAAIAEVAGADIIVLGTPMYNYGMPAALKAWFDQVIRVGRTFTFDLSRGDWPVQRVPWGKRMVVLSARGEFGFAPGGLRAGWNHLDPHLVTCARFLGVAPENLHGIAVEYQEFGDARHARSLAEAEAGLDALVGRLLEPARLASTQQEGRGLSSSKR